MRRTLVPILASLALAACADGVNDPGAAGLRVAGAPALADTADAYPQELLVVRLRDERGVPMSGAEVTYASVVTSETPAQVTSGYLTRVTDANGYATTRIRFGSEAGRARLRIAVPALELTLDVGFEVLPGRPALLVAPAQGLTLGDTIVPAVHALDRNGNRFTAPVTFSQARAPLALSADGRVYATGYGRGSVRAAVGELLDSALVTVVPAGWLAGYALVGRDTLPTGIHALTLDGRRGAPLGPGGLGAALPNGMDWSPGGLYFAWGNVAGNSVMLLNTVSGALGSAPGTQPFTLAHSPQFGTTDALLHFWGSSGGAAGIWRVTLPDGVPVLIAPGVPQSAHISADGARIAYAANGSIVVYDVASGTGEDTGVSGGAPRLSPDGSAIAFIDATGALGVLALETGAVRTIPLDGVPYTLDWSPQGGWLLAGTSTAVQLVELATGLVLTLPRYVLQPTFRFVAE